MCASPPGAAPHCRAGAAGACRRQKRRPARCWDSRRASQQVPNTFSIAVNDYGLELLSAKPVDWHALLPRLIGEGTHTTIGSGLEDEVMASLNATEMARRRFREIARIAGLIFQSHPGEQRSSRQLQASSSLYYDVFAQYDPDN